jgi:hypothetical protein
MRMCILESDREPKDEDGHWTLKSRKDQHCLACLPPLPSLVSGDSLVSPSAFGSSMNGMKYYRAGRQFVRICRRGARRATGSASRKSRTLDLWLLGGFIGIRLGSIVSCLKAAGRTKDALAVLWSALPPMSAGLIGRYVHLPHIANAQPGEGKMLKKFTFDLPFLILRDLLDGHSAAIRIHL